MIRVTILILVALFHIQLIGQEIILEKKADVEQVYKETFESEHLLPMNDMNVEYGYVLYQTEITTESNNSELELENVRDYAVVYVDGKLQGTLSNNRKKLLLETSTGKHKLQLYVENIGRITYGPEILDNSKGLFGSITCDGAEIENWTMITLKIKDCSFENLTFKAGIQGEELPSFHQGTFNVSSFKNFYLDVSGWGMGEVWINNKYMGSYWEQEKQQSIQIQSEDLVLGENKIVVFELKNNKQKTMKLVNNPIFK